MTDLARNFAFSICIVAGLAAMLWGTAWILMQAVESWLKWRTLRKLFIIWLRERKDTERGARRQQVRDLMIPQTQIHHRSEDELNVD